MDKKLLELLVCPICKGKLLLKNQALICCTDSLAFPIKAGIPVMLESQARLVTQDEKDRYAK